jgi:hypothetical protein
MANDVLENALLLAQGEIELAMQQCAAQAQRIRELESHDTDHWIWRNRLSEELEKVLNVLRAARPCVFNSRSGSWEEVLRMIDAVLDDSQCPTAHFWIRTASGIIHCKRCGIWYAVPFTAVDAPCQSGHWECPKCGRIHGSNTDICGCSPAQNSCDEGAK